MQAILSMMVPCWLICWVALDKQTEWYQLHLAPIITVLCALLRLIFNAFTTYYHCIVCSVEVDIQRIAQRNISFSRNVEHTGIVLNNI